MFIQTTNTLWIRQITTQVLLLLLLLFPPGSNELHNLQHAALRLAQWEHRFSQRSPHISQGKWLLGSDSEKLLIDLILLHSGVISFSLNLIQCLADEDTVCQKFFNFYILMFCINIFSQKKLMNRKNWFWHLTEKCFRKTRKISGKTRRGFWIKKSEWKMKSEDDWFVIDISTTDDRSRVEEQVSILVSFNINPQ